MYVFLCLRVYADEEAVMPEGWEETHPSTTKPEGWNDAVCLRVDVCELCVYVCMCVCMFVYGHVCIFICMYLRM